MPTPLLTRVRLQNYKSLSACDVRLGALTFLVGPNGAGKSNFVDALRLVAEALQGSLDHALRDRGGVAEVRRKSNGHPTHFGVRLEFELPDGATGAYAFRVGALRNAYEVQTEECTLQGGPEGLNVQYRVQSGVVSGNQAALPAASRDRLYLVNVSGLPAFRPVYDALSRMGFYSFNPDVIRDLQSPDTGEVLERSGRNLASVLAALEPERLERVEAYLGRVVPGVKGVELAKLGPKETLEFRQEVAGAKQPWSFYASNMSDGALRALGVLVGLFQDGPPVVGVEEPEVALHPVALAVLREALREAAGQRQVLVTTHSPELLDAAEVRAEELVAVVSEGNETRLGPLEDAARVDLTDRVVTAGELLRKGRLLPKETERGGRTEQLGLFTVDDGPSPAGRGSG